jgi:hypothetical protein
MKTIITFWSPLIAFSISALAILFGLFSPAGSRWILRALRHKESVRE